MIVLLSLMQGDYKAASYIILLLQIVAAYVFWPCILLFSIRLA
jgi:hypothetical protein